jgi:hypothetical protein
MQIRVSRYGRLSASQLNRLFVHDLGHFAGDTVDSDNAPIALLPLHDEVVLTTRERLACSHLTGLGID